MQFLHMDMSCPSNDRSLPIDMVILHYTDLQTTAEALQLLCGEKADVSSHYLVDDDGRIYVLVPEHLRAWHAGQSFWQGETDTNSRSIGIEITNSGHSWGYRPFTDKQISAVMELCHDIIDRYHILPTRILAHSDVAPSRKKDPGELFPWKLLSENGIGIWTDQFIPYTKTAKEMLADIGYDVSDENAALTAFQRHFYPESILYPESATQTLERLSAVREFFS